jgi:hypothetical protein
MDARDDRKLDSNDANAVIGAERGEIWKISTTNLGRGTAEDPFNSVS